MKLDKITHQYLEIFPGDFSGNPMQRQTPGVLFSTVLPVNFQDPILLIFNEKLSEEIGLGAFEEKDLPFLVGNQLPETIKPYATAYAGHQFGNWAGQLGDGRAIFAGEIKNAQGKTTEIQWKGAGATPYSRFADGRAVLRSSVREFLMSEAMFHLGIPSTRALSLSLTGENVVRDILYDGHPKPEKGAVVIRTAESFLRFGHFELISAQKNNDLLKKLSDFSIGTYFPEIDQKSDQKYKDFFKSIAAQTATLIAEWMRVGFVHGVMNTDNMSILGLTIDYGPFSMMDEYDLNFTPNTTDLPGRRYAFGKQAQMAQWNLWQLANALFPLINDQKFLEDSLNDFGKEFWQKHDEMLCKKFGFDSLLPEDETFFTKWQDMMHELKIDYTLFFNQLSLVNEESDAKNIFAQCLYSKMDEKAISDLERFLKEYRLRLEKNKISKKESILSMERANPKFVLRNYLLYECIAELDLGKKDMLNKLLKALENPYQEIYPEFSGKRPAKYDGTVGCSTLSCSS